MRNLIESYMIWKKHFPTWKFELMIPSENNSRKPIGYILLDDITQKRKVLCHSDEVLDYYRGEKHAHIAQQIVDGIHLRGSKVPIVLFYRSNIYEINAENIVKRGIRKSNYDVNVYAFSIGSVGAVEISPWMKKETMQEGLFERKGAI